MCVRDGRRRGSWLVEAGETFDVIVTDVEMPVMNGGAFVEHLTNHHVLPLLAKRVLMMTGGPTDPSLAAWVAELPAERTITKPVGVDVFLKAIQRVLDSER